MLGGMPRPRTLTNDQILEATGRVIERVGPANLTLARVAAEVGLAAPTLVQRFGSRRGLLLAYAEHTVHAVRRDFGAARGAASSPLQALFGGLERLASHVATAEAMANNLAFLQTDLSDPEFRRLALAHARATGAEIQALLDDAVAAGELALEPPSNTTRLARAVQVAYNGALLLWAIEASGSAAQALHAALDSVLSPYRRSAARTRPGKVVRRARRGDVAGHGPQPSRTA
jgi:AcrR family transcriptional regulator